MCVHYSPIASGVVKQRRFTMTTRRVRTCTIICALALFSSVLTPTAVAAQETNPPVAGQVADNMDGAASDDAAFAEPGEAIDIDVVSNDDGMDDFDEAPALIIVDQR